MVMITGQGPRGVGGPAGEAVDQGACISMYSIVIISIVYCYCYYHYYYYA